MANVSGWNFDWDDNIFYMPTWIVLYERGSDKTRNVSTSDFATIREHLGKPGEYEQFEVRDESFQFFREDPGGRNYFLEDVRRAIEDNNEPIWIGPSWEPFRFALSRPETAERVSIITARGHSQDSMKAGLEYLRGKGYLRYLPPTESLYAVSNPKYEGTAADPSATKVKMMRNILQELQDLDIADDAVPVVDREGTGEGRLHMWGFSDDDWGNFTAARDELADDVKNGKWDRIKITVFFTGVNDPERPPESRVVRPDGSLRERKDTELNEGLLATLGARLEKELPKSAEPKKKELWTLGIADQ